MVIRERRFELADVGPLGKDDEEGCLDARDDFDDLLFSVLVDHDRAASGSLEHASSAIGRKGRIQRNVAVTTKQNSENTRHDSGRALSEDGGQRRSFVRVGISAPSVLLLKSDGNGRGTLIQVGVGERLSGNLDGNGIG